jgi:hypothetical protein
MPPHLDAPWRPVVDLDQLWELLSVAFHARVSDAVAIPARGRFR